MNAKTFLATTEEGVRGLNSFRMENGTYVSSDGRLNFVELGMFARFTRKMQAGSKYVSWHPASKVRMLGESFAFAARNESLAILGSTSLSLACLLVSLAKCRLAQNM